jgi:hypothetical protein
MYQAEIRGKLSSTNEEKEDILTSNVFSFLKYSTRGLFLIRFLQLLQIQVTNQEVNNAEFEFWPQYDDHTEPDVIITVGSYYLLFEAKYLSDFGEETERLEGQIKRELKQGLLDAENKAKQFFYIPITANYIRPASILEEAPKQYHRYIKWINWQKVAWLINSIITDNQIRLNSGEKQFAFDLYQLLIKKKLGTYGGIFSFNQGLITLRLPIIFYTAVELITSNRYFDFSDQFILPQVKIQNNRRVFYKKKRFTDHKNSKLLEPNSIIFYKGD